MKSRNVFAGRSGTGVRHGLADVVDAEVDVRRVDALRRCREVAERHKLDTHQGLRVRQGLRQGVVQVSLSFRRREVRHMLHVVVSVRVVVHDFWVLGGLLSRVWDSMRNHSLLRNRARCCQHCCVPVTPS